MFTFDHRPRPQSAAIGLSSVAKGSTRYPRVSCYIASQRADARKARSCMPISSRFVVNSTIILLTVGFLALLAIVGATIWLGENARHYADEASQARDTRISAVELRSALQSAESSQRGFLVGGNEIYLAPYDSAKALAQTQFERLKASLGPCRANGSNDQTAVRRDRRKDRRDGPHHRVEERSPRHRGAGRSSAATAARR